MATANLFICKQEISLGGEGGVKGIFNPFSVPA